MEGSKVMFSEAELSLMSNSEIILTKNRIILQIVELFGEMSALLVEQWKPLSHNLPEVFNVIPKISKGEQYHCLPWIMLDYPRCFDAQKGYFAVRTFYWWGHYFTIQLLLSKTYLQQSNFLNHPEPPAHIGNYPLWAGISTDIWSNQFPQASLQPVDVNNKLHQADADGVYKLLISVPLKDWSTLQDTTVLFSQMVLNKFIQR